MATKNKKCLCCNTVYSYCPDCSKKDALAPTWKSEFCCDDCMTLWTTATKYNLNKLTKSEAKAIISQLDLKPTKQYAKCVQRDLGVILAEEPKPRRGKRAAIAVVEEIIPEAIEPVIVETIDEVEVHEVVTTEEE